MVSCVADACIHSVKFYVGFCEGFGSADFIFAAQEVLNVNLDSCHTLDTRAYRIHGIFYAAFNFYAA